MGEVYRGVWTPTARALCFHCHGLKIRGKDVPPEVLEPMKGAPGLTCDCDSCARRIHMPEREDVMELANLRDAINGRTSDGRAVLEQTGGMCAAVRVFLDDEDSLMFTDAEQPGGQLFGCGYYAEDGEYQEAFPFTSDDAEEAAATAAEWVEAFAKWPKISTIEEAKAHFSRLAEADRIYHPDDPAESIVWANPPEGAPDRVFTDAEAAALNKRMREIRALDWSEWGGVPDCPCGYLNAFHPVA